MQGRKSTNVHFKAVLNRLMTIRKIDNVMLSKAIQVTPTAVGNYRAGRVPRSEELFRLAIFFGVTMEELLTGTAGKKKEDSPWKNRALSAEKTLASVKADLSAVLKKI